MGGISLRRALMLVVAAAVVGVGGADARSLANGTLVVQVLGDGKVTSDGGQIDCGQGSGLCYFSTSAAASITLSASPAGVTWSGADCFGSSPTCVASLSPGDAQEEVATFAPATLSTNTLTVNVSGPDDKGGSVAGGQIACDPADARCTWETYTGSTVTLVAKPDDGYEFDGWGGSCTGLDLSCTVSLAADQTVNAAFVKSPSERMLSVSVAGNGTVTGGGIACTSAGGSSCTATEPAGERVTLTATAAAGAGFTRWGGACAGSSTTCSLTMTSDQTVTAAFTGAGSGLPVRVPLTVTVSGSGKVTGGDLDCGDGGSTCSRDEEAGSTITLIATPSGASTFTGWGGACSGTTTTCTVTMSSAKSVGATFSGASSAEVALTVSVSGRGRVTGGGITCGSGASRCSVRQREGSVVGLTAVPARGARLAAWGGACSGKVATCTVEMSAAKSVSARFSSASPGVTGSRIDLRSRSRPLVERTRTGFAVTLRFRTSRRGLVRVHALRAGRLEVALSFTAAAGAAAVGPIPLAKPGFYVFALSQVGRTLHWHACVGPCAREARRAGPFALTHRAATIVDADALWSVTLHFGATQPAGIELRIYRGKRLVRTVRFAIPAGTQAVGPLLLSPGGYSFRLTGIDAFGRRGALTWVALLP